MLVSLPRAFVILTVVLFALMTGPVLLAQAVEAATGVDVPQTNATEMQGTVVLGFISSLAFEWLKKWDKFGLITERTSKAARVAFGFVLAAATAFGVHVTFDAEAGTLMATGLTAGAMATGLWETIQQWVITEVMYRSAVQQRGL